MMNNDDIFNNTVSRLSAAGILSPRLETRLLIAYVLGADASGILPHRIELGAGEAERLEAAVAERIQHKPLCKIIGSKAFYKHDFMVSCDVLSPRPDTEILVEAAVEVAHRKKMRQVLDLGTGSGCILLSILDEISEAQGVGMDISPAALKMAEDNAEALSLSSRATFCLGSWFEEKPAFAAAFDLVVSNPPYIPHREIPALEPEVRLYDPLTALDGGDDGYRDYRQLAKAVPGWLKPEGVLLLEVGAGQAADVAKIFRDAGWKLLEIRRDLSGIERCVILKK